MIIKEITQEETWENFTLEFPERTFLASWSWGELRKELGDKIYRRGFWVDNQLKASLFAYKVKARKGDFILVPHNPLIKENPSQFLPLIKEELLKIAREEKACFVRMAPLWEKNSEQDKIIKKMNFRDSLSTVFPEKSWELSLNLSQEEIFSNMRKSTRHALRKTQKVENLEVVQSQDIDSFYEIYQSTSKRQKFKPFSFEYIKKEFEVLSRKDEVVLYLAKKKDQILAGAMIVFWQGRAAYHHGASVNNRNSSSVPSLIQWQAIKEAHKRNCERYNFWVISPNDNPKHRWAGLTSFKKSFGGHEINYVGTRDLIITKKYWLTFFSEMI
jgi:lipid II:glycine glycyltransferase (peptidoglycan interpeptide bridge formation enzyme)